MDDAISSAINDVKSAGACVNRVEPDPLVSLSDIAARANLTRAAISQYAKGQRGKDFPTPIAKVTSDSPLWSWLAVAKWLLLKKKVSRQATVEAEAVDRANEGIKRDGTKNRAA